MNGVLISFTHVKDIKGNDAGWTLKLSKHSEGGGPAGYWDHRVDQKATVTLNGKPSNLGELKPGDAVRMSGFPASEVVATRAEG